MTGTATRNGIILVAAVALLMAVIFTHIIVTSDAYVTFRVVDNFVHGYGLRWNIDERVQVYTHPLWLLLHIPFYALGINIFYVTIMISCACTLYAVLLTMYTFRKPWLQTVTLFILPLLVSQSFTHSSMNGLENPLSHFLFACFGWVLLRPQEKNFWFWISFLCALSAVNRLDTILLYIPIIGYLMATRSHSLQCKQCLFGALPFIAWELFSLFYYGFLFPNTAYAKLGEGIINWNAVREGFYYLLNLVVLDITSAEFLYAAAILLPLYRLCSTNGKTAIRPEFFWISIGIALYSLYIIRTGGTYLSGRFWSLPVFASIWVMYGVVSSRISHFICLFLAVELITIKLAYPDTPVLAKICPSCFTGGIWPDYYNVSWDLFDKNARSVLPTVNYVSRPNVEFTTNASLYAYGAGPSIHIVNAFAFTDSLLARLPGKDPPRIQSIIWHWERDIPKGYEEALRTGSLDKMDPALAHYYGKLRLIISGDLWDWQRFEEIFKFNRGDYDYLVDNYIRNAKTR